MMKRDIRPGEGAQSGANPSWQSSLLVPIVRGNRNQVKPSFTRFGYLGSVPGCGASRARSGQAVNPRREHGALAAAWRLAYAAVSR